jgi:hypothetical protein
MGSPAVNGASYVPHTFPIIKHALGKYLPMSLRHHTEHSVSMSKHASYLIHHCCNIINQQLPIIFTTITFESFSLISPNSPSGESHLDYITAIAKQPKPKLPNYKPSPTPTKNPTPLQQTPQSSISSAPAEYIRTSPTKPKPKLSSNPLKPCWPSAPPSSRRPASCRATRAGCCIRQL